MKTIRTVLCKEISADIGDVELVEVELPAPGLDEVQIVLKATSVNFTDLLMIQGKYQFKPPLPFAPGTEAAGDVVAIGEDVKDCKPGDRVVLGMRFGGFAEAVNVPAQSVRPIPGVMTYAQAAAYGQAIAPRMLRSFAEGTSKQAKHCWYTGLPVESAWLR